MFTFSRAIDSIDCIAELLIDIDCCNKCCAWMRGWLSSK